MPLITFGKNIFIQNENLEPIKGASVTTYNNQMDSLGHFMSAEDGLCNILITQTTGQAEMAVHMLNWAIRSVKFLGVEFDQSEDEEVSVSDTTHL